MPETTILLIAREGCNEIYRPTNLVNLVRSSSTLQAMQASPSSHVISWGFTNADSIGADEINTNIDTIVQTN